MPIDRDRILDNIDIDRDTGCWLWTGRINNAGYGDLGGGKSAHRVAYELWIGEIPQMDGKTARLDHHCNTKRCCNPMHVTPRTHGMNIRLAFRRRKGQMPRKDLRVARFLHDQIDFKGA